MERHRMIDADTGVKPYGNGLARRDELHPGLGSWPPRPESTLSGRAFGTPATRVSSS